MRSYLPLLVAVCIIGCETRRQARPDWSIVPGQRAGAVTTLSSERELIRTYGAAAVQAARVELGEGETAPGTVLFAADSTRRLEIPWVDTIARARPQRLMVRRAKSQWVLPRGISLGTKLRDLEALNG